MKREMMKVAVIGVGYWGPNLVRNLLNNKSVSEVYCFDIDAKRLHNIKQQFHAVKLVDSYEDILKNPKINGICIATPASTHFPLAKMAIQYDKHVLVEKPFTLTVHEAETLIELAQKKGVKLLVDHIFMYNGAVRKIKEIIESGEIGEILYFDAVRINLGLFQHDVNVLYDLATHDISIMLYLLNKNPRAVSAIGVGHYNTIEDIAYLTLFFENNCIAHFHVNWLAPVKVRRILIGGSQKMVVYDDMETIEKIKVYDKGVEIKTKEGIYKTLIEYRTGDMYAPKFDTTEPLAVLINEFIETIKNGTEPLSNGTVGLEIVKILNAAQKSLKNSGCVVELK
ncbi:MAG: Gfo/Idh/MocA family oxidoreductase [candidate division WOR-3 bacterium]|nr:Gfo/Idh/MocA family oxidoreductase [candidate division WOR-3 bacterium]